VTAFTNLVRGITRPLLVLIALLATVAFIWYGKDIPPPWWPIVVGAMGWWFYDRWQKRAPEPESPASQSAQDAAAQPAAAYLRSRIDPYFAKDVDPNARAQPPPTSG